MITGPMAVLSEIAESLSDLNQVTFGHSLFAGVEPGADLMNHAGGSRFYDLMPEASCPSCVVTGMFPVQDCIEDQHVKQHTIRRRYSPAKICLAHRTDEKESRVFKKAGVKSVSHASHL
jgi:hypothetical protein